MKVSPISELSEADALQLIKGCLIEICSYPRSLAVLKKQEKRWEDYAILCEEERSDRKADLNLRLARSVV